MQKFKLSWEMHIEDEDLLEMVNFDEENQYEHAEDIPLEVAISAMDCADYIEEELQWVEREDLTVEKID